MDYESFFRVPYAWQGVWQKQEFWKGGPVVREMMKHTLPGDDVHEYLSDKLSVSITVFELWPRNVLVNKFNTKDEVVDALVAGASIPGFTGNPIFERWQGKVAMVGGVTLNTPIFQDGRNPQLVINLGYVKYPVAYTFGPLDPNHERLAYEGMDEIVGMLTGRGETKALRIIQREGAAEEGGEDNDILNVINKMIEQAKHFLEFDAIPWGLYGFGFEYLVATLIAIASLRYLGVYDDLM